MAERFGISRAELVGSSRAATPLRARQVAIFLTRELTDLSLPQIGRLYGGRDHSTVLNSLRRVEASLDEDAELAEKVRELRGAIHNPVGERALTADGTARIPPPTAASTGRKPQRAAKSSAIPTLSTSPNPTQEGIYHLKLTTKREDLVSKLSIVSRAVSTRAATQALSGVLLSAAERRVTLAATDLDLGLETTLEADVEGEGSVLLPGRLFAEIARSLADPTVEIESREAEHDVEIRSGGSSFHLRVLPGRGLPEAARAAEEEPG